MSLFPRALGAPVLALIAALSAQPAGALGLPHVSHVSLPHGGAAKPKEPAAPGEVPLGVWAQDRSDLAPDPAVRFGRLPNGMRYVLMKNATPTHQAALRLRFDAGSLDETDAQQGLAHFLEHMAFNGSKNVPEGEMIKILERHGLSFGADTNASTSWDETVYKLDLPQTDDDTVDTALMLLRETASNLTLSQTAMNRERGVVLSEARSRNNPGFRIFKQRETFLYGDRLVARRIPIGQLDIIGDAPVSQIADLYAKYYRPERATLVAVGDFDLDAMEAKIKARFGDWKANGPAGPEPDLGVVMPRKPEAYVAQEAGAPVMFQVSWLNPPDLAPDTRAHQREETIKALGMAVLNRRLERLARADNPPFIAAAAGQDDEFRSADVTTLSIRAEPDTWKGALVAGEHEVRRLLQYGVRQDELDREILEARTTLQQAVEAAPTRQTTHLANMITNSIDEREVVRSPAQDLELFEQIVKGLTAADVSKALQGVFAGQGPLIFLSTPEPLTDSAGVMAAWNQAATEKLEPPVVQEVKAWPYDSFGPPGQVADQKEVLDLDTTFVTFKNGVRLTVKRTNFRKDQILIQVRVGEGMRNMTPSGPNIAWLAGPSFIEGGLKQLTSEEMERIFANKIAGAALSIDDDAFVLSGVTRPDDLDIQMQLLTAYLTEPGYRAEGFNRMRNYGATLIDQYGATPGGVWSRDRAGLIHNGDPRWAFPTRADLASGTIDDLKRLLHPVAPNQPIEVVVVGDVSLNRAIDAVGKTLGALPPIPQVTPSPDRPVSFPAPDDKPLVLTHTGPADQGLGYIAWPTDDVFSDPQRNEAVKVLGYVMQLRVTDQLREVQGATYSPAADSYASEVFPHYGFIAARVEMPPAKLDGFFADMSRIAADLRDRTISSDELERAKASRIQAIEKAQQSNSWWLGYLGGAQADPRRLDEIRSAVSGLERVSAEDVRKAAQLYLADAKAWKVEVVPASGAAPAPTPRMPVGPVRPAPEPEPADKTAAPPEGKAPQARPAPATPAQQNETRDARRDASSKADADTAAKTPPLRRWLRRIPGL